MDWWINALMDELMYKLMDELMDELMDGWMDFNTLAMPAINKFSK